MEYIVIYEKKKGHSIVSIEPKLIPPRGKIQDFFPHIDFNQFGFLIIPEEIISHLELVEYERDKKGEVIFEPVMRDVQKKISSKFDSAFNSNLLIFGETFVELVSVVNLKNEEVRAIMVDSERGIIDIGDRTGFFTVTCRIKTAEEPKIESRKKNWDWVESEGKIIGIKLIDKSVLKSRD